MPAEHIPPTVRERAALYRSVLAQIADAVLVIAGNALTEARVKPLLPGAGEHANGCMNIVLRQRPLFGMSG